LTLYVSLLKTFIGIYRTLHKNYHDTGSDRKACVMLSVDAWLKCLKGKAVPLEPWTDPEGPRRFWLPDFTTVGT